LSIQDYFKVTCVCTKWKIKGWCFYDGWWGTLEPKGFRWAFLFFYLVISPGRKFLTWVGWVSLHWVWIWKISPKNVKFFNFLPFGSKRVSLGRVKKYLDQGQVSLLFTAGQKYVRVGSGPISTAEFYWDVGLAEAKSRLFVCPKRNYTWSKFLGMKVLPLVIVAKRRDAT